MMKNFFKQLNSHPLGMLLILTGYVIGIFVSSLGISITNEAHRNFLDAHSGNPKHYSIMNILSPQASVLEYSVVANVLKDASHYSEIQILNTQSSVLNQQNNKIFSVPLVPVIFSSTPEWQIPLLHGRHFTSIEAVGSEHLVLIGKQLEKTLFPNGITLTSTVNVNGEKYRVIGVLGKEYRQTQWDDVIYVPLNGLPNQLKVEMFNKTSLTIFIRKNNSNPSDITEKIKEMFIKATKNSKIEYIIETLPTTDNSQISNSILGTILIAGLILFVCIINVTNLSLFWILDRRKEFSIKKAIGATNTTLLFSIVAEMVVIVLIAAFLAITLQKILQFIFFKYLISNFGSTLEISWVNWIACIVISILCGIITSVTPIKAVLKMKPAEALWVE